MNEKGSSAILIIIIVVLVAIIVGGIWWYETHQTSNFQSQPTTTSPTIIATGTAVSASTSTTPPNSISASTSTTNQSTSSLSTQSICATVTATQTGDGLGLNYFLNALNDGVLTTDDQADIRCYFSDSSYYTPGNPLYRINLDKNFTNFIFSLGSYNPSAGTVNIWVTDPENNQYSVMLYTRTHSNQVQIIDISDSGGILK